MTRRDGLVGDHPRIKQALLWILFFGIVLAIPAIGATFDVDVSSGANLNASASGPTVFFDQDRDLESGNPFANANSVNVSAANGEANYSSTVKVKVKVDELNQSGGPGGEPWSNMSNMDVSNGNLTIDPAGFNESSIKGSASVYQFSEMVPDDGKIDFVYTASDSTTITVRGDFTDGTQYGAVDADTNEGLDVAVANANGELKFDLTGSSHDVKIQELGNLTIREETSPHPKITSATVTLKFFEDNETDPTIEERSTNNGEIDLTGLPVDKQFSVTVRANGYHNRTIIIDDLSQQETAFLLNTSRPSIESRFVLLDRTGQFPPEDTEIIVQKSINRTEYGGSPSGWAWVTVGGDDLGADEAYVIDLEEEDRYRIKVENKDGDTRILGAYAPETSGTIELKIGRVVNDPEQPDIVGWAANRTNETGESVEVNFEYNDTSDSTTTIWLEIYEYNNQSNVLLSNTSFTGTFGTFTHTEPVPDAENNTVWVLKWTADRGSNENLQASVVVGGQESLGGFADMPDWLITIIFVGSTLLILGLASQLNGAVVGLAGAGWAGMFWFVGLVPSVLGSGVIALSMVAAGIIFVRERRQGL